MDAEVAGLTLGELATERDVLRARKSDLEAEIKNLTAQLEANEEAIMLLMDEQGVTRTGVGPYSMSISEQTVGHVEDWDAVYKYVKEHDSFHLLQRRLSNAAYKEILDLGDTLEGVSPFCKRSLNFRKSSGKSA